MMCSICGHVSIALRQTCTNLNMSFDAVVKVDVLLGGFQTYRCDISEHLSLKCSLDVSTVSLFLLHYIFPVWV